MTITRLWLTDYRNHREIDLSLDPGMTLLLGPNGWGKTNVLEAIAWLSRGSSFRGAPTAALVRLGAERAIVRAEVEEDGRVILLEAELSPSGRNRIQVNRQKVNRLRDLLGHFLTTVFSPDDLLLVKGSPGGRRMWIDDLLVDLHPRNYGLRSEVDRVLRQRNALLKQARGRLTPDVSATLDVWDEKLVSAGEALARARADALIALKPFAAAVADHLTDGRSTLEASVVDEWSGEGLAASLRRVRDDDLRRGMTTTGPQRDDVLLTLDGMPARTHASQGEQRSVALALRLAGHQLVAERVGTTPVVLLDDVFSELDRDRAEALVSLVPEAQVVVTAATALPAGIRFDDVLDLSGMGSRVSG